MLLSKLRIKSLLPFLMFSILTCGCGGYRFSSDYNNLPKEIKSISIPFFKNETFEANIDAYFTNALVNEFIKRKKIAVLTRGADATLFGTVKEFRLGTIAYSRQDRVMEYRAFVTLELTLKNNNTGEIIWSNPHLVHDEEYKTESDIAFTEANEKTAFKKIAQELAEQIYEDIVLGF